MIRDQKCETDIIAYRRWLQAAGGLNLELRSPVISDAYSIYKCLLGKPQIAVFKQNSNKLNIIQCLQSDFKVAKLN